MIIFCVTLSDSFIIWMWIYICYVFNVHWPNFLILESLCTLVYSAIAPHDRSECAPIMSGSITFSCRLRVFAAVLTALTMSPIILSVHDSLHQTSHSIVYYVPLLIRMWCTLHAKAATAPLRPIDLWYKFFPILPFF